MINRGEAIVYNVGGGSSISGGEGGRDVSFERGMSSKAPLWWDPSLVPPVSSLASPGCCQLGGCYLRCFHQHSRCCCLA